MEDEMAGSKRVGTSKKTANAVEKIPVLTNDDGVLCLSSGLLHDYSRSETEFRAAGSQYQVANLQVQLMVQKHPELRKAYDDLAMALAERNARASELKVVQDQIEKLYGISLKSVSIDDRTGVLHEIVVKDGVASQIPLKPKKAIKTRPAAAKT